MTKIFNLKSFRLFWQAIKSTKHEMWVSLQVLVAMTLILSVVLYFIEHNAQPLVYRNYGDALLWSFMWYFGDPGKFADYEPITIAGRWLCFIISLIKIGIFAVPAGLVANGFRQAIAKDKRDAELLVMRHRLQKAFRRASNKTLRTYLNSLPDKGGEAMKVLNFVPQRIPVSRVQLRQGIDFKDIYDVCKRFSEFRVKNIADAFNSDDDANDRFVIETFPHNRSYGYFKNCNSKVTIVCTSSVTELGTGWWGYYLALMGGFNFISKECEVDLDETDSFYNLSPQPLYEKKTRDQISLKDKEAITVLDKKEKSRKDFLTDLQEVTSQEGAWVILVADHVKNESNAADLHFSSNNKTQSMPTVEDKDAFEALLNNIDTSLAKEFNLTSKLHSCRYPLLKKNILYHLQEMGCKCNGFAMRPSSHLVNFDSRKLAVAYQLSQILSTTLDNSKGISEEDIQYLSATGFGY